METSDGRVGRWLEERGVEQSVLLENRKVNLLVAVVRKRGFDSSHLGSMLINLK